MFQQKGRILPTYDKKWYHVVGTMFRIKYCFIENEYFDLIRHLDSDYRRMVIIDFSKFFKMICIKLKCSTNRPVDAFQNKDTSVASFPQI